MSTFGALTVWTLWITAGIMAAGSALLYYKGRNLTGEGRTHTVASVFITTWAAAMYLAMATGYGVSLVELTTGGEVHMFWARYVDWLITTPLLLFELATFADADRDTIATLVGLDAFMIATGLIAGFTKIPAYRYLWWIVSTGAFLVILYGVLSTLPESAKGLSPDARSDFGTLRNLLAGVWLVYPALWIVGTEGLGVVPLGIETVIYAALDVTAKVVFGYLILNAMSDLAGSETTATAGAAASGD